METKVVTRNYTLDWLRVLGILTVFVYHSSRFFNLEDWHIKNPIRYSWVEVWNLYAGNWMMPLMFVISGASLFYAVGKGGAGKFVKDKVLRLLVPLLVGMFTHASLQVYLERITHSQFSGSYFQFIPQYFQGVYEFGNPASGNFATTGIHLWYLYWLFLFSILLYPLVRWLKGRGRDILSRLGDLLSLPGAVYTLALPTLLLLAFASPDNPIKAEQEAGWPLLIYLWLTLAGFLVVSSKRLQVSIQQLRWISFTLATLSVGVYLYQSIQLGWPSFLSARYVLVFGLRALSSWFWILAIFGFGIKHLDFSTPFLKYANEAVLPFYILHQTVLLVVGFFVVQWNIPSLFKWAIILLASFANIMVLYEFVVRRFNVMRVLFGMKPIAHKPVRRTIEPAVEEVTRVA